MLFGRSGDGNCDDLVFDPIYAVAADRGVPLYLHPQSSARPSVRPATAVSEAALRRGGIVYRLGLLMPGTDRPAHDKDTTGVRQDLDGSGRDVAYA